MNWLKPEKQICRDYLRTTYTDDDLIRGLTAARAGILAYDSCCCFAGIPINGAQEAAPTRNNKDFQKWYAENKGHLSRHRGIGGVHYPEIVSMAYLRLGRARSLRGDIGLEAADALRRRRIIPLFLAEIKRRRLLHTPVSLASFQAEGEQYETVTVDRTAIDRAMDGRSKS